MNERVANSFNNLYTSFPEDQRNSLQVAIAEYPYGDKIVDDGYPYWPDRTEIPEQFIASAVLPFGFILKNCCEASDFIFTADSLEQFSNALLDPGGAIGLFEIADCLTGVPYPQKPDWHITAGATSIYVLPNLATQQNRMIIERQFGETVDFLRLKNSPSLIEQLFLLDIFNSIRRKWTVKILFFSRSWFQALRQYTDLPAANALRGLLIDRAWKTFARVRKQKSNRLREHLNDAARNQTQLAESAVSLLSCVEEILAGRRPCFVPMIADSDAGPFGAISREIIQKFTQECWVLAPAYLSAATEVGYIKLDHASPAILNGRSSKAAKDKVIEIMSVLRAAAQVARRLQNHNRANFDLQLYVDLLPHIAFQTPATKSRSAPTQGPSIYKISIDEHLTNAKPQALTQQNFFHPLFEVIPRERSAFFRNSMRISTKPA